MTAKTTHQTQKRNCVRKGNRVNRSQEQVVKQEKKRYAAGEMHIVIFIKQGMRSEF